MTKLWELRITSFRGISIGARHYYGRVTWPDDDRTIERELDAGDAAALNAADPTWMHWEAGMTYSGFDRREDLIDIARTYFRLHAPDDDVLIEMDSCHRPARCLGGPSGVIREADRILERLTRMDSSYDDAMTRYGNQYDELWKQWDALSAGWDDRSPHYDYERRPDGRTVMRPNDYREPEPIVARRRRYGGWEIVS